MFQKANDKVEKPQLVSKLEKTCHWDVFVRTEFNQQATTAERGDKERQAIINTWVVAKIIIPSGSAIY